MDIIEPKLFFFQELIQNRDGRFDAAGAVAFHASVGISRFQFAGTRKVVA